jgi:hypothetical protein
MDTNTLDYLPEDIPISNQKFVLLSVVGPAYNQKSKVAAIKVRGVAESQEEAQKMSKRIMKYDDKFDIFVADVGKFIPVNVSADEIDNVEYQNQELNTLMKSYKEVRNSSEDEFLTRKKDMVEKAVKDGLSNEETEQDPQIIKNTLINLRKELEHYTLRIAAELLRLSKLGVREEDIVMQ